MKYSQTSLQWPPQEQKEVVVVEGGGGGHYREVGVLYNNFSYGVQHVYCVEVHTYCIP